MDTKKLILTIVLCVAVLLVWQYFFMPKPVAQNRANLPASAKEQKTETPIEAKDGATPDIGSILNQSDTGTIAPENELPLQTVSESLAAENEMPVTVDNALFTARFTNRGAGLTSLVLKKYKDDAGKPMDLVSRSAKESNFYPFYFYSDKDDFSGILNKALFLYNGPGEVKIGGLDGHEIIFEYADPAQNLLARKKFIFNESSYVIRMEFQVSKNGRTVDSLPVVFGPDLENNDSRDRAMMMNLRIAAYNGTDLNTLEFAKQKTMPQAGQNVEKASGEKGSGFYWAAYETTYFAAVFKTDPQKSKLAYQVLKQPLGNNQSKLFSYMVVTNPTAIFIGPKDEKELAALYLSTASFPITAGL
jgi:YidC/Oxa1 family membrane protein insertase